MQQKGLKSIPELQMCKPKVPMFTLSVIDLFAAITRSLTVFYQSDQFVLNLNGWKIRDQILEKFLCTEIHHARRYRNPRRLFVVLTIVTRHCSVFRRLCRLDIGKALIYSVNLANLKSQIEFSFIYWKIAGNNPMQRIRENTFFCFDRLNCYTLR